MVLVTKLFSFCCTCLCFCLDDVLLAASWINLGSSTMEFVQSCRSESWNSAANQIKQLPVLMRSNDYKDIGEVFTTLLKPHLDIFGKFIQRVAVSDPGENEASGLLARRVNEQVLPFSRFMCFFLPVIFRVLFPNCPFRCFLVIYWWFVFFMLFFFFLKEQLLTQVKETQLYKHVSKWLYSENFICETGGPLGSKYKHGFEYLAMKLKSLRAYFKRSDYSIHSVIYFMKL